MGKDSEYHILCEMYYEDHDALQKGMRSPEGKASGKDLMGFAGKLVTMMIGEEIK